MQIIKLGGSVITVKGSDEKVFKPDVMARLAQEIKRSGEELAMVHGAGSYGHVKADSYGLKLGKAGDGTAEQVFEVQKDVLELNQLVIAILLAADIPAIMIPTHATMYFENGEPAFFEPEIYRQLLANSYVPVSYGDVVMDTEMRFAICSGDDIMVELARTQKPTMAHFVTNVDGVYDPWPPEPGQMPIPTLTIEEAEKLIEKLSTKTEGKDVTGGMVKKLKAMVAMAKKGVCSMLYNGNTPDNLYNALAGNDITCTLMEGI